MTKMQAYRFLVQVNSDVSWIANVFLTAGGKNCARTLKAMAKLIRAGKEIGSLGYTMPYEQLYLEGKHVTPEELRKAADAL